MPPQYTPAEITAALMQAHCLYLTDITIFLKFEEWRTTFPHTPPRTPTHPSTTAVWNKYSPSLLPHPLAIVPTAMAYTSEFITPNTMLPSDHIINHRASHTLPASNNYLLHLLHYYQSPLIIAIDGSYHPPTATADFPPPQPNTTNTGDAAASAVLLAINNVSRDGTWLHKPTIPLLARVQPLPAAYITNPATNNSAELLARILALKLLPPHIHAIIIYNSQVVHDLHHNLTSTPYTARHLARALYPSISRSLAHRLHHITNIHITNHSYTVLPPTYLEHITTDILNTISNLPNTTD